MSDDAAHRAEAIMMALEEWVDAHSGEDLWTKREARNALVSALAVAISGEVVPMPDCAHPLSTRLMYRAYVECGSCHCVNTDGGEDWGPAKNKWFDSLESARFFRDHGRVPDGAPKPVNSRRT